MIDYYFSTVVSKWIERNVVGFVGNTKLIVSNESVECWYTRRFQKVRTIVGWTIFNFAETGENLPTSLSFSTETSNCIFLRPFHSFETRSSFPFLLSLFVTCYSKQWINVCSVYAQWVVSHSEYKSLLRVYTTSSRLVFLNFLRKYIYHDSA